MENKFSKMYKDSCLKAMKTISGMLERDLSYEEKRAVLNVSSIVMLEAMMTDFQMAESPSELEAAMQNLLAGTGRLEIAIEELEDMLYKEFDYEIPDQYLEALENKAHGLDVIMIKEGVIEISKNEFLMRKRKVRNYVEGLFEKIKNRTPKH
jgi:hypothetical protein